MNTTTDPQCHAFDGATAAWLFGAATGQVPVTLARCADAGIVWLNPRAMVDDPSRPAGVDDARAYGAHLLERAACADAPSGAAVTGWADRYGGTGIGWNGGSGRAAVVGGYHVKGTGRTALIGAGTDQAHASGGAYLEECLREAILSELVAAEFPHGAVPTLGIIDTGLVQQWETPDGPFIERRTLLVRPVFLRPAHFERAYLFDDGTPLTGARDQERVARFFTQASRAIGRAGLDRLYRDVWWRWAEQMAYAWVHRLPHCGDSTSNICLDGKLVDFGAMAAMPGWASIGTIWGDLPYGEELTVLARGAAALARHWGRYVDPRYAAPDEVGRLLDQAYRHYRFVVDRELLRLCGLDRARALAVRAAETSSHERDGLEAVVARLLAHYRREHTTIFGGTPRLRIAWDLERVWETTPPSHLAGLRRVLDRHVPDAGTAVRARCVFRTRGRPALYREALKARLHGAIADGLATPAARKTADAFICRAIVDNRRDGLDDPADAVPIGHARNGHAGYALFEDARTARRFAIREWGGARVRVPLAEVAPSTLTFADGTPPFEGAVAVREIMR
ncbi:hypothetical protein [Massilia sp. Root335]|uniref:hypothetical protein n=1 Tax=Massilia sp. Root335 TaxID=1736517 RepID=UPI0006F218A7|nr:hypothetical protein [Massilia sp. Root335]KQV51803.1 hypothetical protein ASC93_07700 [Massilia sp. Root335]